MLDYQSNKQHNLAEQEFLLKTPQSEPTIALLHCYDLIEDFLDSIKVSLETFCTEFTGSWLFGYINALQRAGVRTVLFCISTRVTETSRFTHLPTGAKIVVLPASKTYQAYRSLRSARRRMLNLEGEFGNTTNESDRAGVTLEGTATTKPAKTGLVRLAEPVLTSLKSATSSLGTYLSTPLGLLGRELRREGCNAILCQEYGYARFDTCVLLGQLMRLPVFASFQGGGYDPRNFLEYPIRMLAFRGCTGLIIAPQTELQRVHTSYKIPTTKLARIFNPLDTTTWQGSDRTQARAALNIPLDARVVVCHGRIQIYQKGLDILLEAWEQICRDRPDKDLRLLLVGTGSDANELRQRLAAMQLRGVMWLDEFVHDRTIIQRYLSAADIYTLASRNEGFPVAPLEAMACGLPVVAAAAPGIPDILEEAELSGGLVVPKENATALAQALGCLLDDEAYGRELGKRARRRIEEYFSSESVGKQLREFILR
jgi:glycosyltransferase involved in cell wall biosynthesis